MTRTPARTRVTARFPRELTRRLVAATKPDHIFLFGSYAYGEPTPYSDLDLMIVTNEPRGANRNKRHRFVVDIASAALRELDAIELDIVARTPEESGNSNETPPSQLGGVSVLPLRATRSSFVSS